MLSTTFVLIVGRCPLLVVGAKSQAGREDRRRRLRFLDIDPKPKDGEMGSEREITSV